jgi:hypothetical protein
VVASLLLVATMGKEHGCTVAVVVARIVAVVVAAETAAAVGIAGDCPNTVAIEVGAADPRVGYTIRYFRGTPLDPSLPEDPGAIIFIFFSSALVTAFISLS